jgi:hypothetical protein
MFVQSTWGLGLARTEVQTKTYYSWIRLHEHETQTHLCFLGPILNTYAWTSSPAGWPLSGLGVWVWRSQKVTLTREKRVTSNAEKVRGQKLRGLLWWPPEMLTNLHKVNSRLEGISRGKAECWALKLAVWLCSPASTGLFCVVITWLSLTQQNHLVVVVAAHTWAKKGKGGLWSVSFKWSKLRQWVHTRSEIVFGNF